MSDTPRTDAKHGEICGRMDAYRAMRDFASTIEREFAVERARAEAAEAKMRDWATAAGEATVVALKLSEDRDGWKARYYEVLHQRDAARAALAEAMQFPMNPGPNELVWANWMSCLSEEQRKHIAAPGEPT